MDKILAAKAVTKHVVAWSTSFAVGAIVRNNVTPANKLQQAEVAVAALVLGYMVAEHAQEAASKMFDGAVNAYYEIKTKIDDI